MRKQKTQRIDASMNNSKVETVYNKNETGGKKEVKKEKIDKKSDKNKPESTGDLIDLGWTDNKGNSATVDAKVK